MARKIKLCRRCERNPAVVNYCRECMNEVSHIMDNQMLLTRAVVCLHRALPHTPERIKVGHFLSLFHPNMPESKKLAIMNDVREPRR